MEKRRNICDILKERFCLLFEVLVKKKGGVRGRDPEVLAFDCFENHKIKVAGSRTGRRHPFSLIAKKKGEKRNSLKTLT